MRRIFDSLGHLLVRPWVIAVLSVAGVAVTLVAEQSRVGLAFLAAVFLMTAFSVWFLTGRSGLGILAGWLLVAASAGASAIKFKYMAVNLHVVDIGFYLRDPDLLGFLVTQMPVLLAGALACAVVAAMALAAASRSEAVSEVRPVRILAGATLAAALVPATFPSEAREFEFHKSKRHFASSFFASVALAPELLSEDPLRTRLRALKPEKSFGADASCPAGPRPDIVLALAESAFPPSLYPALAVPPALEESFRSGDGQLRKLRVEVFGGGTVTSMVGALGGLPAAEFGWKSPYLSSFLKGRIGASLPQRLKDCGYDTAVISPLPFGFIDEGPFLTSLGVRDYKDFRRMQWKSKHERDRVYFDAALEHIDRHRAASAKPLFLFVLTMTAHSPYDFRFEPETKVVGEPFVPDREMNEFLRRLSLSRADLVAFREALRRRSGQRPLLFAEFGDHQPLTTAPLAQRRDAAEGRSGRDSVGLITHYAVASFGAPLAKPLPEVEALDIGFLGATLLEAAGVPPGPVFSELIALRDHCRGRFAGCPDQGRKDAYLKRLVDSGLLRP